MIKRFGSVAASFIMVAICAVSAAPGARAASFTIAQVLSAPFASDLVGSPEGRSIAWVSRSQGVRNIWTAQIGGTGSSESRQLTRYTLDDGLDLGDLTFVPRHDLIAFVRGGDLEFPDKPAANPASLVDGVTREVFLISLKGGAPIAVAAGHAPVASPTGDRLLFIREGALYTASLPKPSQPQRLFQARGAVDMPRFSPDGRRIAFVSQRGDHSFIGVYTFADRSLRWLDPAFALDTEPTWSPDGREIAFIRLPPPKAEVGIGPHRAAPPWAIRIASVDGTSVREVYRGPQGQGSVFHPMASEHQLIFAGESLIFPAENDGWNHLYSVRLSGGPATLLTPGSFEIEWAAPSLDNRQVVYSSNAGDPDRRHMTALEVATGRVNAVTTGNGIEVSPVPLHGGALAYLAADARQPMHAVIRHGDRVEALLAEGIPTDFPSTHLTMPQSVTLPMRAGQTAHGQIFLPATDGKRHPAVIFMHGGPVRQMLAGWHYMDYYSNAYAMNQYLANHGYVVLSLNYRAGIGYGFDFREAEHYGSQGASEYNDLLAAAEFLRARADVEPSRIGLWGGSYGGYMTALGLARNSDLFAAGVDLHGVHDWYNWSLGVRDRAPYYAADIPSETLATAYRASPISSIDDWRSPVLLIHGDDDHNVPFDETVRLVTALQDRGLNYSELVFPDEIHGFLRHASWLRAYQATADFLDQHLK